MAFIKLREGNTMKPTKSCFKCNGTRYIPEYHHIQSGICFSCWGSGSHTFQSNYPKLNSALKEIVKEDLVKTEQEDLLKQIKDLALDFYRYESKLLRSEGEQNDDGMYFMIQK
jgi:hypothetical protein